MHLGKRVDKERWPERSRSVARAHVQRPVRGRTLSHAPFVAAAPAHARRSCSCPLSATLVQMIGANTTDRAPLASPGTVRTHNPRVAGVRDASMLRDAPPLTAALHPPPPATTAWRRPGAARMAPARRAPPLLEHDDARGALGPGLIARQAVSERDLLHRGGARAGGERPGGAYGVRTSKRTCRRYGGGGGKRGRGLHTGRLVAGANAGGLLLPINCN